MPIKCTFLRKHCIIMFNQKTALIVLAMLYPILNEAKNLIFEYPRIYLYFIYQPGRCKIQLC